MMFADLHLHTNFSDGTYSPEELVSQASGIGLAAMALDRPRHRGGLRRAWRRPAEAVEIEFISGTELTAELNGHEVHMLGYCVDTREPEIACRRSPNSRPCARTAFAKWSRG